MESSSIAALFQYMSRSPGFLDDALEYAALLRGRFRLSAPDTTPLDTQTMTLITDQHGTIIYANEGFLSFFDVSLESVQGRSCFQLGDMSERDTDNLTRHFYDIRDGIKFGVPVAVVYGQYHEQICLWRMRPIHQNGLNQMLLTGVLVHGEKKRDPALVRDPSHVRAH